MFLFSLAQYPKSPGGILPEMLSGGVRPASQNPFPAYDQTLRYSLPYLWPDQIFETLSYDLKSCFRRYIISSLVIVQTNVKLP